MAAFDWVELQTISSDIAAARSRLVDARKTRDAARARSLEKEIAKAEARRENLLANISTDLAVNGGPASMSPAPEPTADEPGEATAGADAASAETTDRSEGDTDVWDRLKPSDIERARAAVAARRVETLARHAAELNGLAAEQAQVAGLEQAITAFLQRFLPPAEVAAAR